jgi:hypothetical protein
MSICTVLGAYKYTTRLFNLNVNFRIQHRPAYTNFVIFIYQSHCEYMNFRNKTYSYFFRMEKEVPFTITALK